MTTLLLNILPKEIVAILRDKPRTIADHFDGASILFADIVNFTPMSATMTPTELVELLNEVFSNFDLLVAKYELKKIKTIGDCYMCKPKAVMSPFNKAKMSPLSIRGDILALLKGDITALGLQG